MRYESAISLMRPLAEGLALFAEFDALPDDSPVISLPIMMSAISFANPEENDQRPAPDQWNSLVSRLLLRHRLSPRFIEKKAALLKQPVGATAGSGYLAGYLTVKNIWDYLKRRNSKLWDSDLFLTYFKTVFYDDFGLVAVLLDPDTEIMTTGAGDRDCVERIMRYFLHRGARCCA